MKIIFLIIFIFISNINIGLAKGLENLNLSCTFLSDFDFATNKNGQLFPTTHAFAFLGGTPESAVFNFNEGLCRNYVVSLETNELSGMCANNEYPGWLWVIKIDRNGGDFRQTNFYKKVSLLWTLKGKGEKVRLENEQALETAEDTLTGIKYFLDPLQYYEGGEELTKHEKIQEKLSNLKY